MKVTLIVCEVSSLENWIEFLSPYFKVIGYLTPDQNEVLPIPPLKGFTIDIMSFSDDLLVVSTGGQKLNDQGALKGRSFDAFYTVHDEYSGTTCANLIQSTRTKELSFDNTLRINALIRAFLSRPGQLDGVLGLENSEDDNNPWYTYPCIDFLRSLDFSDCNILEVGAGHSSIFFSSRAQYVHSLESSFDWKCKVESKAKDLNIKNLSVKHVPDVPNKQFLGHYLDRIGRIDVIAIDSSKYRAEYTELMMEFYKGRHGSQIWILDNSDWYPGIRSFLIDSGFLGIDFAGFGPRNIYSWTTTMFFPSQLNLRLKSKHEAVFLGHSSLQLRATDDR